MDLSHLNPSQTAAVMHTDGPLLVLAGAGSGKTRVITHRIARLLDLGVPPPHIVALSFTNKAAGEMRERLGPMVGRDVAGNLVLGTFHSLGAAMMRLEPEVFGLPGRGYSILDQGDVYGVVRSLLREHGHHGAGADRRFDLGAVVQRISLWKNDFVTEDNVERQVVDEYDVIAASIYGAYEERLRTLGGVDFDDLVCLPAIVLARDEEARARWQARFDYVMVDEYQDTNGAQVRMLRQLLRPPHNLCVVGDDDQAIYGWRGAKVENILNFAHQFPGATTVKLQENYRSRAPILECAGAVVSNNKGRHDKDIVITRQGGELVRLVVAADGAAEARWVGKKIFALIHDHGVPSTEIAVLYRSALQAKPIEEELQAAGLPYRVLGGQSMYDKKEVKDAQAYLKALVMPRDELAVRRALETPPRGIGRVTMDRLSAFGQARGKGLMHAVHHAEEIEGIPPGARAALSRFSGLVRHGQARMRQAGVSTALGEILEAIELRDHIRKEIGSDEAAQPRLKSIDWLLGSIDRYESRMASKNKPPRWSEYLGNAALDPKNGTEEEDVVSGKITLATMHSAKGLEWDHVFVIGVEEGTVPHRRVDAPKKSDAIAGDLEEERRLFYVAMTRAREQLWMSRGQGRIDRGREIERIPSRFLEELPEGSYVDYEIEKEEEISSDAMGDMADAFLASLRPPG